MQSLWAHNVRWGYLLCCRRLRSEQRWKGRRSRLPKVFIMHRSMMRQVITLLRVVAVRSAVQSAIAIAYQYRLLAFAHRACRGQVLLARPPSIARNAKGISQNCAEGMHATCLLTSWQYASPPICRIVPVPTYYVLSPSSLSSSVLVVSSNKLNANVRK